MLLSQEDDDEEADVNITAYIYVERPPPKPQPRSSSSACLHKLSDEEKYAMCGVITFSPDDDYVSLLSKLSIQLPCPVGYIIEEKIMWKFHTPANSTYLTLGGEVGFKSLIKQLTSRKAEQRIILLAMPPPAKPLAEMPVFSHCHSQ